MTRPRLLVCPKQPCGQHTATYVDGKAVFDDKARLHSRCPWCGAQISRAHRKSPWWYAVDEPVTPERIA